MSDDFPTPEQPGMTQPATGERLEPVPWNTVEDVDAAVQRARAAQPAWADLPVSRRNHAIRGLAHRIVERRQEIAAILAAETGRHPTECLMSEVVFLIEAVESAIRACKTATEAQPIRISALDYPGKRIVVEAVPRGVIGIIAPWNYPLANFYKSLFPALLSGNAVVLKPSEHTPRSGAWLAEQCAACLPPGLVEWVQGDGRIGQALIDFQVDGLVFTGSVTTGRKVSAAAAQALIPFSVELGGKDAAIVLADCNLDRTIAGILYWGMHNAGQDCAAIERVYVQDSIADEFVSRIAEAASRLRVMPEGMDLGPLQNNAQLRIVEAHVADAIAKGGKVICGGERTGNGFGYKPTILDYCTREMLVVREETFGPVLAITRVPDLDTAVSEANNSNYGLCGSVWTGDIARGEKAVRQMNVGVAMVNNHAFTGTMPETPWSGVRDTGSGVAMSRHAYGTFVRRRTVLVDVNSKPDAWWFPGNVDLTAFANAVSEKGLGSITALLRLLPLLQKRVKAVNALVKRG